MIKDCPFCGATEKDEDGVALDEIDLGIWAVVCHACRAIGPHQDGAQDQKQAINRWNRLRGIA